MKVRIIESRTPSGKSFVTYTEPQDKTMKTETTSRKGDKIKVRTVRSISKDGIDELITVTEDLNVATSDLSLIDYKIISDTVEEKNINEVPVYLFDGEERSGFLHRVLKIQE